MKQVKKVAGHLLDEKHTYGHRYGTGSSVTLTIPVMDEFGDGKEFPITLTYVTTRGDKYQGQPMLGYVYVDTGDRWEREQFPPEQWAKMARL